MLFTLQKECEQQKCELQYLSLSLLLPLPHPISLPLSLPLLKMNGNKPMFQQKLHKIINISVNS